MLQALTIRDMALIEAADLALSPRAQRADGRDRGGQVDLARLPGLRAGLARPGGAACARAPSDGEVTAVFELAPGHPALAVLDEAGIEPNEDDPRELILRRVNDTDGRKTAWINDRRAPRETLRAPVGHAGGAARAAGRQGPAEPARASATPRRLRGRRAAPGAHARGLGGAARGRVGRWRRPRRGGTS